MTHTTNNQTVAPLPFTAFENCEGWSIASSNNEHVAYCDYGTDEENAYSEKATAAFIVRACNAHYKLLTALEQAESELERMEAATGHRATDRVIVGIRRAIAKAKAPA